MQPDDSPEKHQMLDPWRDRYAARASGMIASEVRALFAVAARPEVVSLAGGMPNIAALPLETVSAVMADLVTQQGMVALQYGSAQGVESLRESICEVMALEGVVASPDDVVVTSGSQQALDLVAKIFLDPGDTVVTEAPTYVTAINTFAAYQARITHVPMDDGVIPEALAETFARLSVAVTADDVRGERLVAHEGNTADSDFKRFREECLREGLDPYSAVEVEALSPGALRRRLDSAIEGLVQDVHQWNIPARAEDRGPGSNRRENNGVATDLRRHAVAGHAGPAMAHQKRVEQDGNCQTEGRFAHCIGEAA